MNRSLSRLYQAVFVVAFSVSANVAAAAGDTGSADEAKAMLERAVAAINEDASG